MSVAVGAEIKALPTRISEVRIADAGTGATDAALTAALRGAASEADAQAAVVCAACPCAEQALRRPSEMPSDDEDVDEDTIHRPETTVTCGCACHENTDAVMVLDLGVVDRKLAEWRAELPFVEPFYAVKCNSDPGIVRALARGGCSFDCASAAEMRVVMAFIPKTSRERSRRIIYANPSRVPRDLAFSREAGVTMLVVDNCSELEKVVAAAPGSEIVIRIAVPNETAIVSLSDKYGISSWGAMTVMRRAAELKADIAGFSFHVGSGCRDSVVWRTSIAKCAILFGEARKLGMHPRILDIGGGFPGRCGVDTPLNFPDIAAEIRDAVGEYFALSKEVLAAGIGPHPCELCPEGLHVIAEPGRYMVARCGGLTARVINVRTNDDPLSSDSGDNEDFAGSAAPRKPGAPIAEMLYYIADGCYGTLSCILMDHAIVPPHTLHDADPNAEQPLTVIFGPTCDGLDKVTPEPVRLPKQKVGDWLRFENLGAYTMASATRFNGIEPPKIKYIRTVVDKGQ